MRSALERLSTRNPYRLASILLLTAALLIPVALVRFGAPQWLAAVPALAAYVTLIVLTYQRLHDAALSGSWIILMILVPNVGPVWHGPEPLVLYAGNLLHLIPVAMGWIVPGAADAQHSGFAESVR